MLSNRSSWPAVDGSGGVMMQWVSGCCRDEGMIVGRCGRGWQLKARAGTGADAPWALLDLVSFSPHTVPRVERRAVSDSEGRSRVPETLPRVPDQRQRRCTTSIWGVSPHPPANAAAVGTPGPYNGAGPSNHGANWNLPRSMSLVKGYGELRSLSIYSTQEEVGDRDRDIVRILCTGMIKGAYQDQACAQSERDDDEMSLLPASCLVLPTQPRGIGIVEYLPRVYLVTADESQ
jgi:hypothetical protein